MLLTHKGFIGWPSPKSSDVPSSISLWFRHKISVFSARNHVSRLDFFSLPVPSCSGRYQTASHSYLEHVLQSSFSKTKLQKEFFYIWFDGIKIVTFITHQECTEIKRFALFFWKQRHFSWSLTWNGYATHPKYANEATEPVGKQTDERFSAYPSSICAALEEKHVQSDLRATLKAARFCCAHFPQNKQKSDWIYLWHTPPWKPATVAQGPCNRLFSMRCAWVSGSRGRALCESKLREKGGVSVGGENQMVDQERSAKLRAHHEPLPPAQRFCSQRPFMDLATERTCIKKKEKKRE